MLATIAVDQNTRAYKSLKPGETVETDIVGVGRPESGTGGGLDRRRSRLVALTASRGATTESHGRSSRTEADLRLTRLRTWVRGDGWNG